MHAQLVAFGQVADLFGLRGRELLERLNFPEPWRANVLASVAMIDDLKLEIEAIEKELRALGADHRYVPLLITVPGIAWVLGYTIAAEIGDINRSQVRRSSPATPACARRSTSQAARTTAAT